VIDGLERYPERREASPQNRPQIVGRAANAEGVIVSPVPRAGWRLPPTVTQVNFLRVDYNAVNDRAIPPEIAFADFKTFMVSDGNAARTMKST
jgi:hypothetical protein